MDLNDGSTEHVYSEENVDLGMVYISQVTDKPLFAASMPDYPRIHFFDPAVQEEFDRMQMQYEGYIRFVSSDNAERTVIVNVFSDKVESYYLYQRDSGKMTLLGKDPLSRYASSLGTTTPVSFTSRDGLLINGYLTMPKGLEGKPAPMVLRVHGGPWARDRYGMDETIQFLANRGYAVLQVNYRGSAGYGKQFMEAGKGEFARKMHTDLIDGVNWAIEQGIADKDKICIFGGSYGGYATLVGMTFTPDVFACGVDLVGPSNLVSLSRNTPPYWKNFMPFWHKYVGNPEIPEQREDMESRSPLYKVDFVKNPLLIVQGANDPRVKQMEADQMVKALRESGKEVEYLLFKDEGHGIRKWTNDLIFHRKMEDFLAKHLGGRSAGFDYYELVTPFF
ncbi:MAG TPA: S9 family peptidase [Desulfobulbaceae bacterium]|nr:S9 family peptidase [Desulfobulbaceae bacterium]